MLIPRQPRTRPALIGQILRINNYLAAKEAIYTAHAAAYGLYYDGPWGDMTADVQAFGDVVLEHMFSEGGTYREVLESGGEAFNILKQRLPGQAAVTETVGNSPTTPPASTSG